VLIDLAIERVAMSRAPGRRDRRRDGVKIVGTPTSAGRVAQSASSLYARNLVQLHRDRGMVDKPNKALAVNWDDELVKATALTKTAPSYIPNFQPNSSLRRAAMDHIATAVDPFVFRLSIFCLPCSSAISCVVGDPCAAYALMSVTTRSPR